MKILQIIPTVGRGGTEGYALSIAEAALNSGFSVSTAFPITKDTESLVRDYGELGIEVIPLAIQLRKTSDWNNRLSVLTRTLRILRLLFTVRPDVVHLVLPWPEFGLAPSLACAIFRIPTLLVFQLVFNEHKFVGKTKNTYLWSKSRRQRWIAVSKNNREMLRNAFSEPNLEIEVIYNGVKGFEESALRRRSRSSLCEEIRIPEDSILAVTVGRLEWQKGLDILIEAMPEILKRHPNFHLVSAGSGTMLDKLNQMVAERGIVDNVHFLGHRNDIPNLLGIADLFVFPTRGEGHPFALVEAMAAGVPVVSALASGIGEIIVNGESGILFRSGDSRELVNAIEFALSNRSRMKEMAIRGKEVASAFSLTSMSEKTIESLCEISGLGKLR